jgi:hypothetical protein
MRVKRSRVDALAIVTNAQLKLAGVVADLHFNPTSPGVPERIAQRLAADPIDVVADDRAEGLRRTLDRDVDGLRFGRARRCPQWPRALLQAP